MLFLLFQSIFEKGFLQDVRHNLWENWPGSGHHSGLRQLNPGKIYRKVSLWLLLLHFSQLLQYPFLHPRNLNLGHSHFFCNLCLCHILKIPKYDQSFLLSFSFSRISSRKIRFKSFSWRSSFSGSLSTSCKSVPSP